MLKSMGATIEPISTKKGFTMLLVEISDRRYILWIRAKPVSREALQIAEKIVTNYEADAKILFKIVKKADYTRVEGWVKVFSS